MFEGDAMGTGKKGSKYECCECGYIGTGYLGKCPNCGQFGTMIQIVEEEKSASLPKTMMGIKSKSTKSKKLSSVSKTAIHRLSSGCSEFDRVVGGGIVSDSVNIISAPPGMGKSTLLLKIANNIAETYGNVLYVSGEESDSQVKSRADRILSTGVSDNLYIFSDTKMENIQKEIQDISPVFVVVDSLQMLWSENCDGALYGEKQALTCVNSIISDVKSGAGYCVFLVGQMTKDDELRGSREVEHAVDGVFYLDKIQNSQVRMFRATKNRFGNTEEVGMFEMNSTGLEEIPDPTRYFTSIHKGPQTGCALSIVKEGTRHIVVEVETLSDNSVFAYPQRVSRGISSDQVRVYLAVLTKAFGLKTLKKDVYLQVGGGLKVKEQTVGLAVCAALFSAISKTDIPQDTIFIGEVGLTGDVKRIPDVESIIKDCERFGFRRIIIPEACLPLKNKYKIDVVGISSVASLSSIL